MVVNSDSRHLRRGDAAELLGALGDEDTLLLSPDTHELRAYNRLALIGRGALLVFLQDDADPPRPQTDLTWLAHSAVLFSRYAQVGAIGLSQALFFVSGYDEAKVGSGLRSTSIPPPLHLCAYAWLSLHSILRTGGRPMPRRLAQPPARLHRRAQRMASSRWQPRLGF